MKTLTFVLSLFNFIRQNSFRNSMHLCIYSAILGTEAIPRTASNPIVSFLLLTSALLFYCNISLPKWSRWMIFLRWECPPRWPGSYKLSGNMRRSADGASSYYPWRKVILYCVSNLSICSFINSDIFSFILLSLFFNHSFACLSIHYKTLVWR